MNQNAIAAMLAWPVISMAFFAVLGPWRGVIATYIGAYLLLTGRVVVPMSGLPDYTKYTAAALAALAGILIFDAVRLLSFRPRWYDALMILLCAVPGISFWTNGLPAKEGVTAVAVMVIDWGIPYFVGRLYVGRPGASRDLALGMTVAGGLMFPLIAFEMLTARSISGILYGINVPGGYKFGFYRAVVMATNGLELGIWSTMTGLVAFTLWTARAESKLLGISFGAWTAAAVVGAVICFEGAAMGFLGMGMFLIGITVGRDRFGKLPIQGAVGMLIAMIPKSGLRITATSLVLLAAVDYLRKRRPQALILAATLAAPAYLLVRVTNAISRKALTFAVYSVLGGERGFSLEFRMIMEEKMMLHVMRRPYFGWATFADRRAWGPGVSIVDSMWIIHTAKYGLVGLALMYGLLCLPVLLTSRRRPVGTWQDPRNAAAVGLAVALLFFMFDTLLNAYNIVVVPLMIGFVIGLPAPAARVGNWLSVRSVADRGLERVDRLAGLGRFDEAEASCRRLIASRSADRSGYDALADSYDRLADLLGVLDRLDESEEARRRALQLRVAVASAAPGDFAARAALAGCAERLARALAARGRPDESAEVREMALGQRAALAAANPDDPDAFGAYVDGLNDLAWLLSVGGGGPAIGDPDRAVAMAEQAARLCPSNKSYWNTLGACYHRAGDHGAALAAVRRSLGIGPDESGFDEVIRALSLAGLGDPEGARESLARVDALLGDGRPAPASLLKLRAEAAEALGSNLPAVIR